MKKKKKTKRRVPRRRRRPYGLTLTDCTWDDGLEALTKHKNAGRLIHCDIKTFDHKKFIFRFTLQK